MKSTKTKILTAFLAVFIVLQFFGIDRSVPEVDPDYDFITITSPPDNVTGILEAACYDCHSYETDYPWYSWIAPVSWWLQGHITEGRDEMNFSEWGTYSAADVEHFFEEIQTVVDEEEMPLYSYTLGHSEARLTREQRDELINWINTQYSSASANPATDTTAADG